MSTLSGPLLAATLDVHPAADEDAEYVRRNTAEQNQNLDIVGGAAADIKRLAYVSNSRLATGNRSHFDTKPLGLKAGEQATVLCRCDAFNV